MFLLSSDVRATSFFDVFARVESTFNHFRSVVYDSRARVAAISAVEKEVDAASQLLRSLRNTLAPISLLPPEVLARVFHFLALEEPPCSGEPNLGWIGVTHVCRLWRQVALGDSSLWARIEGFSEYTEWISEMLSRARNAPLDIDIDFDEVPSLEVLHMLPPHLSHSRELCLHYLSNIHSDGVRGIYTQEAPALEHFELVVSVTSLIAFQEFGGKTLFKGQAPRLRTLILAQVLIPWSLIPRGQLTRLTIGLLFELSVADVPSYGDLNQLIDLLANSPELEVLVLGCCLPSQLAHFQHGRTIHLPRLARLCLGGSSSRITNLSKMLKLPSSTKLHFHCIYENTPTHNDYLLLPVISAHFQSPSPVEFQNLNVTLSNKGRSLIMTALTSLPTSQIHESEEFESDEDDLEDFLLSFDGLPELGHWTDLVERVCKILPISNLESLSVSAPDVVDSVKWVDLFKRCTKVTTLQATGHGTSSLVRALTSNMKLGKKRRRERQRNRDSTQAQPARSTVADVHAPMFAKLTCLSLKELDFDENEHPSGILFNVVDKGLRQRKVEYRAPLKMLSVDSCAISSRRAKALEKLVQRFHWDGKESTFDELEDSDDSDSDFIFIEPRARWENYSYSTPQGVVDWMNYPDGWPFSHT
jgi:hypothetical protein